MAIPTTIKTPALEVFFSQLQLPDLMKVAAVSKSWYQLSSSDKMWKKFIPQPALEHLLLSNNGKDLKTRLFDTLYPIVLNPQENMVLIISLIKSNPKFLAEFLRNCTHQVWQHLISILIDQIKEFKPRGWEHYNQFLTYFAAEFDFRNLLLSEALRMFLLRILPLDLGQIETKLCTVFAKQYTLDNPAVFSSALECSIVCVATLRLNESRDNPFENIRAANSVHNFLGNVRASLKNIPRETCERIYNDVLNEALYWPLALNVRPAIGNPEILWENNVLHEQKKTTVKRMIICRDFVYFLDTVDDATPVHTITLQPAMCDYNEKKKEIKFSEKMEKNKKWSPFGGDKIEKTKVRTLRGSHLGSILRHLQPYMADANLTQDTLRMIYPTTQLNFDSEHM